METMWEREEDVEGIIELKITKFWRCNQENMSTVFFLEIDGYQLQTAQMFGWNNALSLERRG